MRIQHNIMAMNAYRNYNTNTSALSKNLEKLSSGYKINRAGDDAAGLAISEKMRAQITGLNAAQKNVKDGISLVKTAEGAMQEIQDMLNRMDYLATQSANGTYDNDVDRVNLQKEVKQLQSEINRIADSANFNGIKLLDGSLESGDASQIAAASSGYKYTDDTLTIANAGNTHGTDSVLHKDGVERVDPEFVVDLTDVEFTAADDGKSFSVKIGDTTLTINKKDEGLTTAFSKNDKLSGEALAKVIAAAVNANETDVTGTKTADGTTSAVLKGVKVGDLAYKATASGNTIKFELQTSDKAGAAINPQDLPTDGTSKIPQNPISITLADAADGTLKGLDVGGHAHTQIVAGNAEKDGEMACADITLTAGQIKDGTKLTIGNKTYVFAVGKDSKVTQGDGETLIDMKDVAADDAQLLDKAIAKLTQQDNGWFRLESKASGKLTAVETKNYAGTGDLKTFDGLKSNFKLQQKTELTAAEKDAAAAAAAKGLTLQIGDTSDGFNQLKVNVGDMHVGAMYGLERNSDGTLKKDAAGNTIKTNDTIANIDISTREGASKAINTIKDAINYVSGIRGDLGATQNRLEHTANNLSVMAENIQDAESTIRDTDVAEEMMAYTKNNILIQSAQAMLAQANAVPQGVLQLLG